MKKIKYSCLMFVLVLSAVAQAADRDPRRIGPETTLTFDIDKAVLTKESREKLSTLIEDAKDQGKISEIQVAVWSDNPAPRPGEELSKADRELAGNRSAAIGKYLKLQDKVSMDAYNMADRASWLARAFDTSDAELKSEIGKGGNAPMSKEEFRIFRSNGQPSKAVVLVIMKHST